MESELRANWALFLVYRLRLLGWRFRAMDGPGLKKVSLSYLYFVSHEPSESPW